MSSFLLALVLIGLFCTSAFRAYPPFNKQSSKHALMSVNEKKSVQDDVISHERLVETLARLKAEREKQQLQLLTTEVAIANTMKTLDSMNSANRFPGFDYGFKSRSTGSNRFAKGGLNNDSSVPANAIVLAADNFQRELNYLIKSFVEEESPSKIDQERALYRAKIKSLTLSNAKIWEREHNRPAVKAPWIIKAPYLALCLLLDALFEKDPMSRFYFLETVARMPYFSYITMLHTYETLGWWRRSATAKRVHFAEEYNEYHHLLIWEALGGDQEWRVRFFAQHSAIAYFFALIIMWLLSPSLAYNFSELIEAHAVDTYAEFAESNEQILRSLPPPLIAKQYYEAPDMYIYDEFQTSRVKGSRRPQIDTLYDVVCSIRDDEAEHVKTMAACQDPDVIVQSPNTEAAVLAVGAAAILAATFVGQQEGLLALDSAQLAEIVTGATAQVGLAVNEFFSNVGNTATSSNVEVDSSAVQEMLKQSMEDNSGKIAEDAITNPSVMRIIAKILSIIRL